MTPGSHSKAFRYPHCSAEHTTQTDRQASSLGLVLYTLHASRYAELSRFVCETKESVLPPSPPFACPPRGLQFPELSSILSSHLNSYTSLSLSGQTTCLPFVPLPFLFCRPVLFACYLNFLPDRQMCVIRRSGGSWSSHGT